MTQETPDLQKLDTTKLMQRNLAELPTAGPQSIQGAMAWALDGRKSGESSSNGTGVPVYADVTDGVITWLTYRGDIEVTV